MFFFQPKNDPKHIADVKVRNRHARNWRTRLALTALAISSGLVLATLLLWKGTEAIVVKFVYENPSLAIQQLDIQTDGIIPVEQIRKWAGVKVGDNLLQLDLHRVKRDLELVPLVAAVSLERILPRRLNIRVIEREPIARMRVFSPRAADGLLEAGVFYLDREGVVMPPIVRSMNVAHFDAATATLPTLTGLSPAELRPGYRVHSPQVHAALKWISLYNEAPIASMIDVVGIDLTSPGTLLVTTTAGNDVTFEARNFENQLARWQRVVEYSRLAEKPFVSLDLAVTNYIPIVWAQLETNSVPVEVKPLKRTPYKRRHV